MTSSISQNIAIAAAKVTPVTQPQAIAEQRQATASDPQATYAASKLAAEHQSSLPKTGKEKIAKVPKRAESPFEKTEKKRKGKAKQEQDLEEDSQDTLSDSKIDVIA